MNAKMPVLFVGHGSPMNAIEENEFSLGWRNIALKIPIPKAILCISAHWETKGIQFTAVEKPETIHDFGGFPRQLYEIQYNAPGNPDLAGEAQKCVIDEENSMDFKWGLDHGSWSVLRWLYPEADIPVVQMSLDYTKKAGWHYNVAKNLARLRENGVLIIGSGNMVHNLRLVDWQNTDHGSDWAEVANIRIRNNINDGDYRSLTEYDRMGAEMRLAVPSPEHFLPLLYPLALKEESDTITWFNDKVVMGSISMTSLLIEPVNTLI